MDGTPGFSLDGLAQETEPGGMALKALLIGGDRLIRECFRQLLRGHLDILAEFSTVRSALSAPPGEMPHVFVFLEVPQDEPGFLRDLAEVKARWPLTRTILLVRGHAPSQPLAAACGTVLDGCFCLDLGLDALVHVIKAVLLGGRFCSTPLNPPAPEAGTDRRDATMLLTARQGQILALLADGHSNKEIARRFGLSDATIKVQVRSILRRLGVDNRTQAAVWARNHLPASAPMPVPSLIRLPYPVEESDAHRIDAF